MLVTGRVTLVASMSIRQSLHRQLRSYSRGEQFRANQGQEEANHLRINATSVNILSGRSKYAALRWISTGFPSRDRANELSLCDLLHRLPQIRDEWGTLVARNGYFGGPEALVAAYLRRAYSRVHAGTAHNEHAMDTSIMARLANHWPLALPQF